MMNDKLLISFDGSRLNNFTTLRIFLAWCVLYGHGYAIQNPNNISDPLNKIFLGSTWIGDLAVNGFFAISGFLVTGSIIKRGFIEYSISRMLRIYPALIVCVFFTVFIIGSTLTTEPLSSYFTHPQTFDYLKNSLLIFDISWDLPGLFKDNQKQAVNGSLWTLPTEVSCYIFLAITSLFAVFKQRTISNVVLASLLIFGIFHFQDIPIISIHEMWARPALYFLIGVFFYINRDKILINLRLAILASIILYFSFGHQWFVYLSPISLVYLLFYLVYGTKYIKTDQKLGDISYGLYIYAWPTQQAVAQVFSNFSPILNTIVSTIVAAILAYFSWHFLEKPMLSLKKKLNFKHKIISN
jgi:peptidoglycan/LPS O-acetylase OafA/YrhL